MFDPYYTKRVVTMISSSYPIRKKLCRGVIISKSIHNVKMPMQYTELLKAVNDKIVLKDFVIFRLFVQNIDCVTTLEPP